MLAGRPGGAGFLDQELRTAEQLIDGLSMAWNPHEFRGTYQERVARLVEAKRTGKTTEKAESPADPTDVVPLMDALRASVDRAEEQPSGRGGRGGRGGKGRARGGGRTSGARGGHSRGAGDRLERLTRNELYERAADAGVPGRSGMNRRELIEALSGSGDRREAS